MISTPDRQALLELCNKFINSGEDVTLAHLLDSVNSTILDRESQDFKDWSKYMEQLNETWVLINKEDEQIPWPEPPPGEASINTLKAWGLECGELPRGSVDI